MSSRILLLDNDDSFTFLFADRLRGLGAGDIIIMPEKQAQIRDLAAADALIISPGPGLPQEHKTSRLLLQEAVQRGVPTLGICLGFQMQAMHFGALLYRLQAPRHGMATQLSLEGCRITGGVPMQLQVGLYHSWAISREHWPHALRLLACDDEGVPMALEHTSLPFWGLQFHPESILTPEGDRLLSGFLQQVTQHCR